MRLSHRLLERLRQDPSSWLSFKSGSQYYGRSKFQVWQDALKRFHRDGGTRAGAVRYLEERWDALFKPNPRELTQYSNAILSYCDSFDSLGHRVLRNGARIDLMLGSDFIIGGEVTRVDLVLSGGHAAYVIEKGNDNWRNELRMPLLQMWLAQELDRPASEISVGVYDYSRQAHETIQFNSRAIRSAVREANALAVTIDRLSK